MGCARAIVTPVSPTNGNPAPAWLRRFYQRTSPPTTFDAPVGPRFRDASAPTCTLTGYRPAFTCGPGPYLPASSRQTFR